MRNIIFLTCLLIAQLSFGQTIQSPLDVDGRPAFEFPQAVNGVYEGDIELPRLEKGGLIIVDGLGKTIILGPNSRGITTPVSEGESPLSETRTRYLIKNFSAIIGGKSAIKLTATFNSRIENVECIGQSEVAISLEFCLMCRVQNVLITNPARDGITLGTANFDGWGTALNSQCNGTTLEQVRVYNAKHTVGNSFTIKNSNGITLRSCISEGHQNDGYAVYYEGQNATVKNFTIDNFHLEHAPLKGGIYIDAQAQTKNTIRELFAQKYNNNIPVIVLANNAPVLIEDVGWWGNGYWIKTTHHAPRIIMRNCHGGLNVNAVRYDGPEKLFTRYIHQTF